MLNCDLLLWLHFKLVVPLEELGSFCSVKRVATGHNADGSSPDWAGLVLHHKSRIFLVLPRTWSDTSYTVKCTMCSEQRNVYDAAFSVQWSVQFSVQRWLVSLLLHSAPLKPVQVEVGLLYPAANFLSHLYLICTGVFGWCYSLYLYFHSYFDLRAFSRIPHRWSRGGPSTIASYSPSAGSKISMNKSSEIDSRRQPH